MIDFEYYMWVSFWLIVGYTVGGLIVAWRKDKDEMEKKQCRYEKDDVEGF